MATNKSKSAILVARLDRRTRAPRTTQICGIPVATSYKYLGV